MAAGWRLSSEPLIFLYTIIFTINYTVIPQFLLQKLCLRSNHNVSECKEVDNLPDQLHKEAATWWFSLLLFSLLPTVFTVLVWGPVTDIIGRRRAMIVVPLVNGTRSFIYILNAYFITAHPAYIIFASFLSSLYGEFQGVVALCYAYMADMTISSLEQRTMRMAFVEASLFLSGIPAGLLSGYLLQTIGFVSVFTLTCGINLLMLLYVVLWLPESRNIHVKNMNNKKNEPSHDVHDRHYGDEPSRAMQRTNVSISGNEEGRHLGTPLLQQSCWKTLNPFHYLLRSFKVVTRSDERAVLLCLLMAFGFTVCAVLGELIVQALYLTHEPFSFTYTTIGYYSASQSLIRGFGVITFTQISFHCWRMPDHLIVVIGLLSSAICYFLIGVVRSAVAVFLVNITGFAIPAATTALRSLVTKQVSECEYGSVLAILEALGAAGGVASNCISLWMYGVTLQFHTGIVYFVLSGFAVMALLIVVVAFCRTSKENHIIHTDDANSEDRCYNIDRKADDKCNK